jgi:hypothetical protein
LAISAWFLADRRLFEEKNKGHEKGQIHDLNSRDLCAQTGEFEVINARYAWLCE